MHEQKYKDGHNLIVKGKLIYIDWFNARIQVSGDMSNSILFDIKQYLYF